MRSDLSSFLQAPLLGRLVRLGAAVLTLGVTLAGCSQPIEPGPARGAALFDTCAPCHGDAGEGNRDLGAPAIAGMESWYVAKQLEKFSAGIRGSHPDDPEGLRMGPMARSLRDGDIASVSEHVASLPAHPRAATLGGDAAAGQAAYGVCTACHGPDGRGNKALGAPSLLIADDWYLARQIEKFQSRVRGADPRDTTGAQMAPMAATLATEQSIANVLAYVTSLNGGTTPKETP